MPFGTISGRWLNSGMAFTDESLTLNMSEWNRTLTLFHSGDVVCSLSDILETGDHLAPYFLSPRACARIVRRVENRGKTLPEHLARALRLVVDSERTSKPTAD